MMAGGCLRFTDLMDSRFAKMGDLSGNRTGYRGRRAARLVHACVTFAAALPTPGTWIVPAILLTPRSAAAQSPPAPAQAAGGQDETIGARVDRALERAVQAVLREERLQVSDLWNLRKLLSYYPQDELRTFVDRQAETTHATPYVGLVRKAPPPTLPEDPGRGLVRLGNYIAAPFGEPEDRAIEFLRQFLSRKGEGYVLTHQFLVLEWAKDMGRKLPDEITSRRKALLRQMAAEQSAADAFSDLFAERAGLLLCFDNPAPDEAARWIRIILDAHQPDGTWGVLQWTAEYDGKSQAITGTRMHTATWAMLALAAYRSGGNSCPNSPAP